MTATAHRYAAAFLRSSCLVAAVLAIIAGIFGMHVLTGNHAMHAPASVAATADAHSAASPGHAAEPGTFISRPSAEQDTAGPAVEQCSESGHCSSMHDMTAGCTPSAKTASLTVPPPGTFVLGISDSSTAAGAATRHWSYLPVTPSPCELSISRT